MLTSRTKIVEERLYTTRPTWVPIDLSAIDYSLLDAHNLEGCTLILVCGVSTVGKTTLLRALHHTADTPPLIPRATTRPPRVGERDGSEYFFSFKNILVWSEFGGHFYAITDQVMQRLVEVKKGIMIQGLLYGFVLKKLLKPRGVTVKIYYILPDSLDAGYKQWSRIIQERLVRIHPESAPFRIESIQRELKFIAKHTHTLKRKGVQFIENPPHEKGFSPQALQQLASLVSRS